ncbi:alpha-E domain-containing protein [Nibricoccus sp. IMCC34717]|uniref:alpha-E domain-containing protein n=1 Tax=Nibricoccus sp. IMCC34717 TaxID=3034021 RepID=UPI00384A778A
MLSRVANLIYWTARYLERAENTARIADVNAQLVLDLQSRQAADDPRSWNPLVYVCGGDERFRELHGEATTERAVIEFMLFDRRNPSSFLSCIAQARENARCIRDQLAGDVWEELNTVYLKLKDDDYSRYAQVGAAEYLAGLRRRVQMFYSVADSMIPRTRLWWFFELGRFLERADNTSRILDVKYFMLMPDQQQVGSALDMVQWASVLRSCSAFEAFRQSRRGQLSLERVVDYLVRDKSFPRSIRYSAIGAEEALRQICDNASEAGESARLLRELLHHVDATISREAISGGLHEYLDDVQQRIGAIHAAIQSTFVNYPTSGARVFG